MKEILEKLAYAKIDQYDLSGKERPQLDASDYGLILVNQDTVYPKFPIDTPEHVKESADALDKVRKNLPDEIVHTAEYYINQRHFFFTEKLAYDVNEVVPAEGNVVILSSINIDNYLDKLSTGIEEPPRKYAINLEDGRQYIPLNSEDEIKEACQFIKDIKGAITWDFPGEYRIKIARAIINESPYYFVDIPADVTRYAYPDTKIGDIKKAAKERIKLAGDVMKTRLTDEERAYLKKIASGKEANLVKVCEFFNDIDERTGYASYKRRMGQGDAYDELFLYNKSASIKSRPKTNSKYLTKTEEIILGEG